MPLPSIPLTYTVVSIVSNKYNYLQENAVWIETNQMLTWIIAQFMCRSIMQPPGVCSIWIVWIRELHTMGLNAEGFHHSAPCLFFFFFQPPGPQPIAAEQKLVSFLTPRPPQCLQKRPRKAMREKPWLTKTGKSRCSIWNFSKFRKKQGRMVDVLPPRRRLRKS
jgi:hypothetical protein